MLLISNILVKWSCAEHIYENKHKNSNHNFFAMIKYDKYSIFLDQLNMRCYSNTKMGTGWMSSTTISRRNQCQLCSLQNRQIYRKPFAGTRRATCDGCGPAKSTSGPRSGGGRWCKYTCQVTRRLSLEIYDIMPMSGLVTVVRHVS